jgi:DNA invertase Pin-like site-specific DNA recombinase
MKYVSYLRVSTKMQGSDGLGIAAQRTAIRQFLSERDELLAEFVEVESGKNNRREELLEALECARKKRACLVIAKLDRLSRDIEFIFRLKNAGVEFKALDIPEMSTLTLGIFSVMAQHEREVISRRVKAALAERRARGLKHAATFNQQAWDNSLLTRRKNKALSGEWLRATELIGIYRKEMKLSYAKIAERLNASGYLTIRGKTFDPKTVHRLYISQ